MNIIEQWKASEKSIYDHVGCNRYFDLVDYTSLIWVIKNDRIYFKPNTDEAFELEFSMQLNQFMHPKVYIGKDYSLIVCIDSSEENTFGVLVLNKNRVGI